MQPRTEAFRQFQYPTVPLAVYPDEAIQAHLAFLSRRRALRPT
jgi:capsule polysaccharide modification protein KpsS